MEIAKIFQNGGSQAVRLPKDFRFNESEVCIRRNGDMIILFPKNTAWARFMESAPLTDDVMEAIEDARREDLPQEREQLE